MKNTILSAFMFLAIIGVIASSIPLVDATGKPDKTTSDPRTIDFQSFNVCSEDVVNTEVTTVSTLMVSGDGNSFKLITKKTTLHTDIITEELIAKSKSTLHTQGQYDESGVYMEQFHETVNCMNGDKNFIQNFGITVTKDEVKHNHGK
jgi:hypothetical protein